MRASIIYGSFRIVPGVVMSDEYVPFHELPCEYRLSAGHPAESLTMGKVVVQIVLDPRGKHQIRRDGSTRWMLWRDDPELLAAVELVAGHTEEGSGTESELEDVEEQPPETQIPLEPTPPPRPSQKPIPDATPPRPLEKEVPEPTPPRQPEPPVVDATPPRRPEPHVPDVSPPPVVEASWVPDPTPPPVTEAPPVKAASGCGVSLFAVFAAGAAVAGVVAIAAAWFVVRNSQRVETADSEDSEADSDASPTPAVPPPPTRVHAEMFVASQNAPSARLVRALGGALASIGPVADLSLDVVGQWNGRGYEAVGGEMEVVGDAAWICGTKQEAVDWLPYVSCTTADGRGASEAWRVCGQRSGLDGTALAACVEGPLRSRLVQDSFFRASQRGVTTAPALYLNGVPYMGNPHPLPLSVALCGALRADAPAKCASLHIPPPFQAILLTDSRCTTCDPASVENKLLDLFASVQVTTMDAHVPEGRALYDRLHAVAPDLLLPAALLPDGARADEEAMRALSLWSKPVAEFVVVNVGGTFNPTLEVCSGNEDDDGDGFVDCLDPDCAADPACVGVATPDGVNTDGPVELSGGLVGVSTGVATDGSPGDAVGAGASGNMAPHGTPARVVAVDVEVGTGEVADSSSTDANLVQNTVARNSGQLKYCYEQRLRANPNLTGRVEIEWTLNGGRVTSASVFLNTTLDDEFAHCIVAKIKRWSFDPSLEGEVTWPFIFRARSL